MKNIILVLIILISKLSISQNSNIKLNFESKWIKDESYNMTFYRVNDTTKTEVGKITNVLQVDNGFITQCMIMKSKMFKNDFVDITTYNIIDLKPVFHSSNNDQRMIMVSYNTNNVNAIYKNSKDDKIKTYSQPVDYKDTFLESSAYQNVLRWLPLKDGFTEKIKLFNYDPNSETGFIEVQITNVTSEKLQLKKSGEREVFKVTELYGEKKTQTIHYIDKEDRRLWKVEINGGIIQMIQEE